VYSRLALRCSIFSGIGSRLWAGGEVPGPGVPTRLVDGRLGLGVVVKPTPSWAAAEDVVAAELQGKVLSLRLKQGVVGC